MLLNWDARFQIWVAIAIILGVSTEKGILMNHPAFIGGTMAKRKIHGIVAVMFLILAVAPSLPAQQPANNTDWSPLKFLLGDWVGVGDGGPGQGSGGTSFNFDLQNKILVRKNWADYAATKDRPAASHNDLMIVYPGAT